MSRPTITVAVSTYDRHAPLFDGTVTHPDFDFQFSSSGSFRHERFLESEWEVAEFSLSSYLIARDRGVPIQAVPVFPRRLFSQSQIYKNKNAGIEQPADLAGKRVALNTYQTTLCVLAKGDLAHYYGVPWKEIRFVTAQDETIDVPLPEDVQLERLESRQQIEEELVNGTIAAFIAPGPPRPFIDGHPDVVRLFSDSQQEEQNHLVQTPGYFPIMHVVAIHDAVVEKHPGLPQALYEVFEEARKVEQQRWNDPNHTLLLWGKRAFESEARSFVRDPWENGLSEANVKNLEDFVLYSLEQGLIQAKPSPQDLFIPVA